MKEVLEYSKEELLEMSDEELNVLLKEAKDKENLWDTKQMTEKIMINSLYGALANKYFPLFNEAMASAITGNGRYFIRKLAKYIEDTLQAMHKTDKEYIVYGDTDSVLGSTLVKIDDGEIKIKDLYDLTQGVIEERGENNFIKHPAHKMNAASLSPQMKIEYNNINYIMKHKVKKRMYKIKCGSDTVTITEDHSMIVLRDNKQVSIKPKELQPKDKLIKIHS